MGEVGIKKLVTVCRWVTVVACLNVAAFIVMDYVLGGDAFRGGLIKGQYYLAQRGHYTAVTYGTWLYSYIHAYSAIVSVPIGIIAGIVGDRVRRKHPKFFPTMAR